MTTTAATPATAPDASDDQAVNPAALVVGVIGGGKSHRSWLRALDDRPAVEFPAAAGPACVGKEGS